MIASIDDGFVDNEEVVSPPSIDEMVLIAVA